jgi:peptide/nickel transport system substrate-binding protein
LWGGGDIVALENAIKQTGAKSTKSSPSGGRGLMFNTTKAPLDDVRVRQAISFGIDRDAHNQTVNNGFGAPAKTIFASGTPFFDQGIAFTYDPAKAQQLLNDYYASKGKDAVITISTTPSAKVDGEYLQGQLSKLDHIKVDVLVDPSLSTNLVTGNYQVGAFATYFIDPEPTLYEQFLSTSPVNRTRFKNTALDTALTTGHTSLDQNTRKQAYADVQRILVDQVPMAWYARLWLYNVFNPKVQGTSDLAEEGFLLFDRVWLKK